MLCLTSRAVTKFAVQRLLAAQLILHFTAVAASIVYSVEVLSFVMDLVWRPLLPGMSALCTSTGLMGCWVEVICISLCRTRAVGCVRGIHVGCVDETSGRDGSRSGIEGLRNDVTGTGRN